MSKGYTGQEMVEIYKKFENPISMTSGWYLKYGYYLNDMKTLFWGLTKYNFQ